MKQIILATATTNNYIPKIVEYLYSIQKNSNFDHNILITLDCEYNISQDLNKIQTAYLSNSLVSTKNPNNCLQHGDFLKTDIFNKFDDKDYICFTDGDIIMQRGLTDEEKNSIMSLKDDQIMVQYNASEQDNLFDESSRIIPKCEIDNSFSKYKCYNTGVMICNIKTWKKLESMYRIVYPIVKNLFSHYAAQQWTLSYIINLMMSAIVLDYSFHTHHHFGIISGNVIKNNMIYHQNNLVLFAHHVEGISA